MAKAMLLLEAERLKQIEALVAGLPAEKLEKLKSMPEIADYLAEPPPVAELSEQDKQLL